MSAMEAALVSGILKTVGLKLAPLVISEFNSIAGVTKDLQELQDLVEEINAWLQTVGDKAIRDGQSSNWIKKLKDAAYDADDLVHDFYMQAEKHGTHVVGMQNAVVKYLWTKPKSLVFKCKTAHKIKEITKRFDAIVKGRSDYSTIANCVPVDLPVQHISKTTGEVPLWTNVDEASVFGRDQVKVLIISELIKTNDQQNVKVVSVNGLGGSGKTTLAKLIFNDTNTIKGHFEVILWVHVSREFVVEKLVEKLFEAIAGDKPDHFPLQRVSRTISDKLAGKRFLLVLDDVWTEDRIHWEQFMVHLKSGAPGSSILLTTRSRKVAEAVDSAYTCDLPFLCEADSWKVFQQSFGFARQGMDPEFLEVGNEIVKKCGGVPLAIKVIAGVLRGMKRIDEWESIRDSSLLDVEGEEHRVSACLWLSYFHLPHHLKQCFTHCSIFPRGYTMNKRRLISQWIANGFVKLTNRGQLEDVGNGYFDSLLKVGFLQDPEHQSIDEETTCKMHDLVHDLTRQILRDELVSEIATVNQMKWCRYLSLTSCTGEIENKLTKIRTLFVSRCNLAFNKKANTRCHVRTVILDNVRAASLPLFVSKFQHLGYLEIFNINCEVLPEAISCCWNLQAIHVLFCGRLVSLPESIGNLMKLRTLELKGSRNVRSLPQSIGGCNNLQNLYLEDCELEDIPNSVVNIEKLRVLSIVRSYSFRQVLPLEAFGKLCNLQTITLRYCYGLQQMPLCITLLSHLEYVDLEDCHELVELPEDMRNLKKLQVLNLQGCHKLCGLPAGCGQLTRLQKLGLFVIGASTKHARISELENLDKLSGELQITNINYVNDLDDVEKVHLKKKNGIQRLSLQWSSMDEIPASGMKEESLLCMEKDLHLLNSLQPPSEIEKLRVNGYRGSLLPHWMTKQSVSCDQDDMHMLKQSNPSQFSHLTELMFENLANLENLQGLMDLPGIRILKLSQMPKLVELLTTRTGLANVEDGVELQCCFPHLISLVISDCPKLIVKPYFPPSLQKLTVEASNEQLLSSCSFFHPGHAHSGEASSSSCNMDVKRLHLTQLNIGRMIGSSSGWEVLHHLTGLHELKISKCEDLLQLPESMRGLTYLHRLEIEWCDNLSALPEWLGELQSLQRLVITVLPIMLELPQSIQRLTSLQYLDITACGAFDQLPEELGGLCSLQTLILFNLPSLVCLPECMQCLTSLQTIDLYRCDMLTQLPESLCELSSLRSLLIVSCPGLTSLPRSMQNLTTIEKLIIVDCPELVRRCKEGVGEDWHLVSHIPHLTLMD